jgi:penicillin-binding protein 1A
MNAMAKVLRIRVVRLGLATILGLAAFAVGGAAAGMAILARDLPTLKSLEDYSPPVTSRVYDANGNIVARFYEERRTVVPVERIPAHVKNAFIAAEDADFYQHEGVDYMAVVASVLNEVKVKLFGGSRRGGSTITQQTAKTFLLSPEQTYSRKLKEMLLAKRIEDELTKDEILHLYLNQIYFGHGAYGVEEAARTYYGKSVTQLTLGQAAALAGVPKSPSRMNPLTDPKRLRTRRAYVLKQMVRHGLADEKDVEAAKKEPVRVHVERPEYLDSAPYYADAVKQILIERYGEELVKSGGLKVYAALDARLQRAAHDAMQEGLRAVDKRQGWRGPLVHLDPDEVKPFLEALEEERERRFPPEETPAIDKKTIEGAPIWDLSGLTTKKVQAYLGFLSAEIGNPPVDGDGPAPGEKTGPEKDAPKKSPKKDAKKKPSGKKASLGDSLFPQIAISSVRYGPDGPSGAGGEDVDVDEDRYPPMRSVKTTTVKVGRIVGGLVKKIDNTGKRAVIDLGPVDAVISAKGYAWARKFNPTVQTAAPKKPGAVLKKGDVVLVRIEGIVSDKTDAAGKPLKPWLDASLEQEPKVDGAFAAVDPHSHRVLALIGGYAKRQPGSSFKPFIYAKGIETKTFTPVGFLDGQGSRLITDAPKVFFDRWTGKKWAPKNSGGRFRGDITTRTCLTYSVNTCSLTILEKVGVEGVHELAKKVQLLTDDTPFPKNLTLALGTGEVTPLSVVNAYTVFPGGGMYAPPVLIEKVKRPDGKVLEETTVEPVQVLSPQTAFVMSDMMKSVVETGTATRAKALGRPVAGKTGTTNRARSVWFLGFTPDIVAGAYVGFDNNDPLGPREYGGKAALPIWLSFMQEAVKELPERDFEMPDGVVRSAIDARTGLLAGSVAAAVGDAPPTAGDTGEAPTGNDVETVEAPEAEEGELPPGVMHEVFIEGTEPLLTAEESAPPPLELLEGTGGLGP